jgi:peptide/nickel transport system substrate-binding protein
MEPNRLVWMAVVLLSALLLAACGGNAEDTAVSDTAVTEAPIAAEESVARQDILRVAMQPIVNTDPLQISSDSEVLVANHVYDYLVDVDAQSRIAPRLATSWDVSDDGLTYTFELAQGVTWHDGSPFTAQDVVYTFIRLRDTEGAPTADLYANVTAVDAPNDATVTFTLAQPNPFFLYDLSDNHALIIKDGTTDAASNFNGTGPFKVASYSPEDRIELVANEAYFVEGQPKLAGVTIIFFNDDAAAVDALRGGQIDLAMRMSTALFQTLADDPNLALISIPTNGFDLVRLRADRAPGDDPRVMQALRLATDREAILAVVQQGFGAVGNDTPIGPLYPDYHDETAVPPARDVAAAQALLAEAGYADGLDLTLHVPDTGGRPDLAAMLKEQWAEAGVNVELSVEPESVYYGDDGWLEVDLGITGWGSRPYPQFYLDVMLTCEAIWNESHFCDPAFDELVRTAGTTLDEAERIAAYEEIQAILIDRGPVLIPYYFAQFAAINNQFENFEVKAFAGRTDFRNVIFSGN